MKRFYKGILIAACSTMIASEALAIPTARYYNIRDNECGAGDRGETDLRGVCTAYKVFDCRISYTQNRLSGGGYRYTYHAVFNVGYSNLLWNRFKYPELYHSATRPEREVSYDVDLKNASKLDDETLKNIADRHAVTFWNKKGGYIPSGVSCQYQGAGQ